MSSKFFLDPDDYYAVLGVDGNVSDGDLSKAYKKLVLKHHPDKNPHQKEEAEREFKRITEAYEFLRCPEKRKTYDQHKRCRTNRMNAGDSVFSSTVDTGISTRMATSERQAESHFMKWRSGSQSFGSNGFSKRLWQQECRGGFTPGFGSSRAHNGIFGSLAPSKSRVGVGRWGKTRSRSRSRGPQRSAEKYVVPNGSSVIVQGLTNSLEHNQKNGEVVGWDPCLQRYEVRLSSNDNKALCLRQENITQLCIIEVTGLRNMPSLMKFNGLSARIFNYDNLKRQYMVSIDCSLSISLPPANCILGCGTSVIIDGLVEPGWNGQRACIISIDRSASRYTIECESGKQIKIKYGNILC